MYNKIRMKISIETKKQIITEYTNDIKSNCLSLSKKYNINHSWVWEIIKKSGIKPRTNQVIRQKYSIDDSYFTTINSPEKAQILGLIYADGYNHKVKNNLQITLMESDIDYLQYINAAIKNTRPLAFCKKANINCSNCYKITAYSSKICEDLEYLGCPQKKSLILKFPTPNQVPNKFLRDFILGYFEGDGSIQKCKDIYGISICGTLEFCNGIREIIKNKLNINPRIAKRHKFSPSNNYTLSFGGGLQILRFLNWIYKDSVFRMERKYLRYMDLKSKYVSDTSKNRDRIIYEKRVKPYENVN